MVNQNKNNEINLGELFFEMLYHWKLIASSTILLAVIAFLVSKFLITPQYESTSRLYVLSKSTSITSFADIQLGSSLTDDYMEVVNSRPVVEQVIANLGLPESYGQLVGKISLQNPSNSRILKITVTDSDPHRAKVIADELATVSSSYISEKMDQDPPTIIQYGYDDGGQVSPNIRKNTMWGATIGMCLSVAVVILIFLMNDTIMNADDIERKLGINLLGILPLEDVDNDYATARKNRNLKKG